MALGNSLFGHVKLNKNADPDKYKYFGYGIGFDARRNFSLSDGNGIGKNVKKCGPDMSLSVHIDNKKKDLLILCKVPADGLDDTSLTAENEYSINLTEQ